VGKWDWDPSLLSFDSMFVTPLVVTQFLNMTLETVIPYYGKKYRGKPLSLRHWFGSLFNRRKYEKVKHAKRASDNQSARKLARDVSQLTRFFVPVLERSDDDNRHTAYEVQFS
jgi:hypothetical protein